MKKTGKQKGENLLSKTVLHRPELMNSAGKILKSIKRSRKKVGIQYADSHNHGTREEILESLYRYFTNNGGNMKDFIENVERDFLIRALIQFDGNQKNASKFLGLKKSTMCVKCKKYRITFRIKPILSAENPLSEA